MYFKLKKQYAYLKESLHMHRSVELYAENGSFCRDKEGDEGNIGHISKPPAAVFGENPPIKTFTVPPLMHKRAKMRI